MFQRAWFAEPLSTVSRILEDWFLLFVAIIIIIITIITLHFTRRYTTSPLTCWLFLTSRWRHLVFDPVFGPSGPRSNDRYDALCTFSSVERTNNVESWRRDNGPARLPQCLVSGYCPPGRSLSICGGKFVPKGEPLHHPPLQKVCSSITLGTLFSDPYFLPPAESARKPVSSVGCFCILILAWKLARSGVGRVVVQARPGRINPTG